jgi:hypothetical protein
MTSEANPASSYLKQPDKQETARHLPETSGPVAILTRVCKGRYPDLRFFSA